MAVLAPLFGGRRITPTVAVGIALGLGGVALLLHPGSAGAARWQTFVVLISPMLWACGSLYARRSPTPSQPALATAMEMLLGGVLLTVFGLLRGELGQVHLSRITGTSIGAFVYLVLIGAVIGYSAYIWLLHHVPATSASTYAFVNPVVAVVLGALVLGERVTAATLGAAGLIVAAVVLILTGQARAARRFEAVPEAAGGEPCEVPVSEVA